jgi:fumarate hydratase subunit beta
MYKKICTPLNEELVLNLQAGDRVLITGKIYSARDAAHKKMQEALKEGSPLPFDAKGQLIYYAGPCPAKPGYAAGPFGPTTSGRMDKYAPAMMEQGLKGMMGKGDRTEEVIEAMKEYGGVYFAAVGGLGAYTATVIKSIRTVAYEELGAEALRELAVEDFPAIVAIDCRGNNLYKTEPPKYKDRFDEKVMSGSQDEAE